MVVARALRQPQATLRGARRFDPARDLGAVAHLLEEAFRPEHTFPLSNVPFLRKVGVLLWQINYNPISPEHTFGFVWAEDGQLVGNVTVMPDGGRLDRYAISNVAVKPAYRSRGIARQLMIIALDELRARAAKWALLNVRPTNSDAMKLYRDLGFQEIELRGEWTSPPSPSLASGRGGRRLGVGAEVRPLCFSDQRAALELIRTATPTNVQQFRSPRFDGFALNWEDRITEMVSDFFIGQVTHRYALEQNGKLAALLAVRGQRIASPHRIAIEVHPDFRGRVENDLIAFALRDLARFPPRDIRAVVASTHPELIIALEQQGFRFLNGLTLMALAL
jgi:ribosomal protein S18 acetylase RimI-like enzyme